MRKFIVSDLHGNGEVYDSIMGYLENINLVEDVELYINGDLIDRGFDSLRMLEDIRIRIASKDSFTINYLAGNHELLMYRSLNPNPLMAYFDYEDWTLNGGWIIQRQLEKSNSLEEFNIKKQELRNYLGTLKIYHEFDELIDNNKLLLVHAQAPEEISKVCNMTISDNNSRVYKAVWTRKEKRVQTIFGQGALHGYNPIGKEGYLTIIGHTPVNDFQRGFDYDEEEKVLNIDGGCAFYATGCFDHDRVPLVEVKDNYLKILIFNHNNEIVDGFYFKDKYASMNAKDLKKERLFINHKFDNNGLENKKLIKEIFNGIKS